MSNLQNTARRMVLLRHVPGFQAWNRLFFKREHPALAREAFGLHFPHPLGLAPVLDHQVDLLDGCDSLGYCFTGIIPDEIGTVALRLSNRKSGILAYVELRADENSEDQVRRHIVRTYSLLYDFADFFVVDINPRSGLSSMDDVSDWKDILDELLELRLCYDRYKPILLRFSPDQPLDLTHRILDFSLLSGLDGVIAPGIGLVKETVQYTKGRLPVIGAGAINSPAEAAALLDAGAVLLEVAQGIPYHIRSTARRILQALDNPTSKK